MINLECSITEYVKEFWNLCRLFLEENTFIVRNLVWRNYLQTQDETLNIHSSVVSNAIQISGPKSSFVRVII
jgi:hypothetical protein